MEKSKLTEDEKKARRREINRRYYQKLKARAASGDKKAKEQKSKNRHRANFAAAKTFIKSEATRQEISELRDLMATRVIELRKKDEKI